MEKKVEIAAYHGWGLDSSLWAPWKRILPAGFTLQAADRGYFGKPAKAEFKAKDSIKILFLHSYGLHWCPVRFMERADIIVIFSSFVSYFPIEKQRLIDYTVHKRTEGFKKDPSGWYRSFMEQCCWPEQVNNNRKKLNVELLCDDLENLHRSRLMFSPNSEKQVILFEAEEDRILPDSRKNELEQVFGQIFHYKCFEGAGHLLPKTNSSQCYSILKKLLPIFK